ncbi:putative FBD-associated F-box protein At3g50710 [Neltuma alba]|uniref:putative FBD-associated F-box protein At3g50710 n=1 Tax=Neltuma alba TaxID=207710 RepID=UPI0010A589B8|nr:putative FBD-associated F-box protein At3g50710 [Prosopis alba]
MSDRTSNLPDSLLLHILSSKSLQTNDVVATSLLSKRWRSLWYSIPKLEFHDALSCSYESFLQFIDATLILVDLKSVKMFSLLCDSHDLPPHKVDIWVNAVLKSKLEYLNLWFNSEFGSALHMLSVEFSDAESLEMLLSECVRLQELLLLDVDLPDYEDTKLDIGRLHHLVIADVPEGLFQIDVFFNVTFLSLKEHDFSPDDHDIPTFYNLTHLEVDLFTLNGWVNMVSCLPSFPKLETFIIREQDFMGVDWSMEPSPDEVPPCVSSHLKTFALKGFEFLKSEFQIVGFILKHAIVLRPVIITTEDYDYPSPEAGRQELLGILSSYPKRSRSCKLFVDVPAKTIYQKVYNKLVEEKDFSYYFEF